MFAIIEGKRYNRKHKADGKTDKCRKGNLKND